MGGKVGPPTSCTMVHGNFLKKVCVHGHGFQKPTIITGGRPPCRNQFKYQIFFVFFQYDLAPKNILNMVFLSHRCGFLSHGSPVTMDPQLY